MQCALYQCQHIHEYIMEKNLYSTNTSTQLRFIKSVFQLFQKLFFISLMNMYLPDQKFSFVITVLKTFFFEQIYKYYTYSIAYKPVFYTSNYLLLLHIFINYKS